MPILITGDFTPSAGAGAFKIIHAADVVKSVSAKSGTYTAAVTDDVLLCDGTFTIDLYTAVGYSGNTLDVKNVGTGVVTVDASGSQTIDGALTVTLSNQYDTVTIVSDGSNWHTIPTKKISLSADVTGQLPAASVAMPKVGTPTIDTLAEDFTTRGSAGVIDGTLTYVTAAGASSVDVAAGEGYIRTSNDQQAELKLITWAASSGISIPAPATGYETTRFIGVEYNSGSPQVTTRTTFNWNWYDDFPLARVSYDGTTLRILNAYAHSEDTANLTRKYLRKVFPFQREAAPEGTGGLELSETGTRNLAMSAGNIWHGFNLYTLSAVNTAVSGSFYTHYRRAGGGFVSTSGVTQYPNTQYDDGTGTLATMTASRYACLWVYVDIADGGLDVMYGTGQYTSVALAQEEAEPSTPDHLAYHARLIGRIIFQKSAATASLIESAWSNSGLGSSSATSFAAPSANSVGIGAPADGVASTAIRSDATLQLDLGIVPTWTGAHTFSAEARFNGGLDMGTSGRLDSNVADSAGNVQYQFTPTVAMTAGSDRTIFGVYSTSGTGANPFLAISSGGHFGFNTPFDSGAEFDFKTNVAGSTATNTVVRCFSSCTGAGATLGGATAGIAAATAGGSYSVNAHSSNASSTATVGLSCFVNAASVTRNLTDVWGIACGAQGSSVIASAGTITHCGGWKVIGMSGLMGSSPMAVTNWYGGYVANSQSGTSPAPTKAYGLYLEQQTKGVSVNNGAFFANASSGYKAIAIRDQTAWIGSDADGELNLNGTYVQLGTGQGTAPSTGVADCDLYTDTGATNAPGLYEYWKRWVKVGGVLWTKTSNTTVTSTISDDSLTGSTGLGSITIPANFFVTHAGKTIRIRAEGYYTRSANNITLKVKWGGASGTELLTSGAVDPGTATNGGWYLDATITCRTVGASVTVHSQGNARFANQLFLPSTATVTVDTTIDNDLVVTAFWSGASQSITCTNMYYEVLN